MQFLQSKNNEKFSSSTVYAIDSIYLTNEGIVLLVVDIYQTYGSRLVKYLTLEEFFEDWKILYDLSKIDKKQEQIKEQKLYEES